MPYVPRIVDAELAEALDAAGAVLIEGPRACGKTATARKAAASEVLLDVDAEARAAAGIDPALILEGPTPRLIDEWQIEPRLWDHIRRAVDERAAPGQFILAGSAVPPDEQTRHVGAGRIIRLRMRPMSLAEAGHANGAVSLAGLLAGDSVRAPDPGLGLPRLVELICIGGWPGLLGAGVSVAQRLLRGYLADTARVDVRRVDTARRDARTVERLLRSLARNVATAASVGTLTRDANGSDGNLKDDTIRSYLGALERLMIVDDLPAWAPSIRSRTRLRTSAVRHFVDPSLAAAALRATPARLLRDLNWTGLLFENLVVRDLRVFAQAADAQVFSYRDESGLEADAILELGDGRWAAFEVKLGASQIDAASESLRRLRDRVDTAVAGEPAALAVITAGGFAYTRPDGVSVIPIGTLGA